MGKNIAKAGLKNTDVVILCGGKGLRLRKIIHSVPKPMAEINGRPFLEILVRYLKKCGASRFVFCTGYKAEKIKHYFQDTFAFGEIIFSRELKPLGTAGALKNAKKYIVSDPFIVVNGDSFCKISLSSLLKFHMHKNSILTMAVTRKHNSMDYGHVELDSTRRIVNFKEKRNKQNGFVNSGIYVFKKRLLELIPAGVKYSLEKDLFPTLMQKGCYAYVSRAELLDIGTPLRYKQAQAKLSPSSCGKGKGREFNRRGELWKSY